MLVLNGEVSPSYGRGLRKPRKSSPPTSKRQNDKKGKSAGQGYLKKSETKFQRDLTRGGSS